MGKLVKCEWEGTKCSAWNTKKVLEFSLTRPTANIPTIKNFNCQEINPYLLVI